MMKARSLQRAVWLVILVIIVSAACRSLPSGELSADEYAVYLSVVRSQPPGSILIAATTDTFGEVSSGRLQELIPGIQPDTITDWVERNAAGARVPNGFAFEEGYEVTTPERHSEFDPSHSFSRVGFSRDGRQAFVRHYFFCGALCGERAFYLLEKKQGRWEIMFKSESWKA